ncbi:MAG: hypothetical protein ACOVQM_17330 [Pirellula sp.]
MSFLSQSNQPVISYRQPFGTFVEGFDSILYSESRRQSNRLRLLAELFYGLTYDSCIVLPEPAINDNYVVIRLMRLMQDRKLDRLRDSLVYIPYRDRMTFIEKAILNADYVCSSLSANTERERVEFLRASDKSIGAILRAHEVIKHLLAKDFSTAEDHLVLDSYARLVVGDTPWLREQTPIKDHGFSLSDQLRTWLSLDSEYVPESSIAPNRIAKLLSSPDLWPENMKNAKGDSIFPWKDEVDVNRFNMYFGGRSYFHKAMSTWRDQLGNAVFGRMEEYVNSGYGIALQKTCGAYTAVRTPMDISNPNNTQAQQIMNGPESNNANSFEFCLNLEHLQGANMDGSRESDLYERTESAMLDCLETMFRDRKYEELKKQMLDLKTDDGDYKTKFVDSFGKIADFVNGLNGPFTLIIQGNFVINILNDVSTCKREILGEDKFNEANGCEHKNC